MSTTEKNGELNKTENTKKRLIDISIELFNEHGYDNVGVRDIAAKAGVTTGSFYHHFKNKEEVLHKKFQNSEDYLLHTITNSLKSEKYSEKIVEYMSVFLASYIENDGYELTGHRLFAKDFRDRRSMSLIMAIENLVKKAQQEGELSNSKSSSDLTNILLVSYRGVVYDWVIEKGEYNLYEALKEHLTIIVEYFSVN